MKEYARIDVALDLPLAAFIMIVDRLNARLSRPRREQQGACQRQAHAGSLQC